MLLFFCVLSTFWGKCFYSLCVINFSVRKSERSWWFRWKNTLSVADWGQKPVINQYMRQRKDTTNGNLIQSEISVNVGKWKDRRQLKKKINKKKEKKIQSQPNLCDVRCGLKLGAGRSGFWNRLWDPRLADSLMIGHRKLLWSRYCTWLGMSICK